MILSKKVRLYPSEIQEQKLWQSVGTARFIYNWTLSRQEENYKNGGKFISDNELRKEITQLKKDELSWLNKVSNNVAKQAVKDGCDAYKRFFKGLSDKPRFKSRRKSRKSFYNDNWKLKVKEGKLVNIEKVGWIKTNEQIPIGVKYSNPRISYDNKYWYISIGIEQEEIQEETFRVPRHLDPRYAVLRKRLPGRRGRRQRVPRYLQGIPHFFREVLLRARLHCGSRGCAVHLRLDRLPDQHDRPGP